MKPKPPKFTADTLYERIRADNTSSCRQHDAAARELAALASRYPMLTRLRRAYETSSRHTQSCQLELKFAVSKSASRAAREEFLVRAAKLGWRHLPNHEEHSLHLASPAGVRLAGGEVAPPLGSVRVALFKRSYNLLGEQLTMQPPPLAEQHRARLERAAAGKPALVVGLVRWDGKAWQPLPDEGEATSSTTEGE